MGQSVLARIAFHSMYRAQRGECAICGKLMHQTYGAKHTNVDHVIPKSAKTPDVAEMGNIVLTHADCNVKRGAKKASAFQMSKLKDVNDWFRTPTPLRADKL